MDKNAEFRNYIHFLLKINIKQSITLMDKNAEFRKNIRYNNFAFVIIIARGFNELDDKDQQEILNLIAFKKAMAKKYKRTNNLI